MEPIRALICDDEPLALDRLTELLSRCRDVDIVGAVLSGSELLDAVAKARPNVILLDIEMPRMDGFDAVEALSRLPWDESNVPPLIIFVTAHPDMAVHAYDSGALDFISKPVRLSRLERALQRARQSIEALEARSRLAGLSAQLDELKRARAAADAAQHLWVRKGAETIRVDVDAIDWIEAEGEYVRVHSGQDSFLERGSLTDAADRFAPFGFVRIHRSAVVNPNRIASMEKATWGGLTVRLQSGDRVPVGRKFRAEARALVTNRLG